MMYTALLAAAALLVPGLIVYGVLFAQRKSNIQQEHKAQPTNLFVKKFPEANVLGNRPILLKAGYVSAICLFMVLFTAGKVNKPSVIQPGPAIIVHEPLKITEQVKFPEPEQKAPPVQDVQAKVELPPEIIETSNSSETKQKDVDFTVEVDPDELIKQAAGPPPVVDIEIEAPVRFVENMPEFPGGVKEMYQFIGKVLRYPSAAANNGIEGKVVIEFVVDKEGNVGEFKVLRGLAGGCTEEVIRILKNMPKWKPGKQQGRAVPVYYTLPVSFDLAQ